MRPTAVIEAGAPLARDRPGRWIAAWDPENEQFWQRTGRRIARRNLLLSVFSEHVGFSVWSVWSVLVLFLTPAYGFSAADKFLLTTVPTVVGAALRLPYTFAVARFGGRNWTLCSALLLFVPAVAAAIVLRPGVSLTTLVLVAALGGVGGGNFASSMANINAFYPDREKGWALGLNAGGGNLGVAAVQLAGLLALAVWGSGHPRYLLLIYLPVIALAAAGAALGMDNLASVRNDRRGIRDVLRYPDAWLICVLYIGTFGSFIGFGFALGQVLQVQFAAQFPTPLKAAYVTFLGPLIGSLIRPLGGRLADRYGGATVTFLNFVAMAASASLVLVASLKQSLPMFLTGFVLLFVFSGVGNGSTFKMIPALFARRLSAALIGLAGAVGAFGGALVNLAFRESFLRSHNGDAAYTGFLAFYALCFVLTYVVYVRPGRTARR